MVSMSGWKEIKPPHVQKNERFIKNFWKVDDYLLPTINMQFMNKGEIKLPTISPEEVVPGKQYYPALSDLKRSLMMTKSKLDSYNVINWSKHTNFTYLFSDLTKKLHTDFDIELCTTAWAKMWEILHEFFNIKKFKTLKDRKDPNVRALFLCEGPGSFITCTNHFLKTHLNANTHLDWSAITLVEQDNSLFDKYFPNWAPNNWFFGPDNTGDILNPNNIVNGVWPRFTQEDNKCDLITADGSVSCQHDPNNQELIVAPIKMAEIAASLKCLKKGGLFVIKYFTCLEPQTVCQLWLLASVFRTLNVFKPVTSKPGNSEIYVICNDFCGTECIPDKYFDSLVQCPPTSMLFSPEIVPKQFIAFVVKTMSDIVNRQIDVIEMNIKLFHSKYNINGPKIHVSKDFAYNEYIKRYGIQKMNSVGSSLFI
jgi:cap2 methyltransferase